MAKLIAVTAPTLSSIQLKACPLIGLEFSNALGIHYASSVGTQGSCLLELSLEDLPSLSKIYFMTLASASDALQYTKSLSLRQIDAVDDEVVHAILSSSTNGNLEEIDLSNNVHLTDQVLSSIRSCNFNGRLKSSQLSGIKNLTAAGLEAFFTFHLTTILTLTRVSILMNGMLEHAKNILKDLIALITNSDSTLQRSLSSKSVYH